jgi:hypothetical protein
MKWLLKEYEYTSETDYYDMVIASYANGQMEQTKRQFLQLRKCDRIKFLKYVYTKDRYSKYSKMMNYFLEQIYAKQEKEA